ncbi:MAG: chorismate mutase [Planctomycetes bacterium]|jgi:chorismate mutase|nr:chorismate mutase [Planctomycetota bacterium]
MSSAPELDKLRAAIDDVNRRLVALLHERGRLCRTIGSWKRAHGVPAADPDREAAMRDALLRELPPDGYERDQLDRILQALFAASRALVDRSATPAGAPRDPGE